MDNDEFADYIWEIEDKYDLADNYHIYTKDQFYSYVEGMTLDEMKKAFLMAWESLQE
jgi:hypothetical protein